MDMVSLQIPLCFDDFLVSIEVVGFGINAWLVGAAIGKGHQQK